MREIEFRAKRTDNDEWVYGSYMYWNDNTGNPMKHTFNERHFIYAYYCPDFNLGGWDTIEVNPETIGQYTGAKDKNGKKIYEGDIVKIDIDKALVTYSDEYSGFILKPIGEYYFDSPMLGENIDLGLEVIGNIYDNPEL